MTTTTRKVVGGTAAVGTAAVIAATVAFLPGWEGMDKVAKRDMIGTGHPITYCYGQTDEFGKVRVGTRFTKQECDAKLAESLPRYLAQIGPCVKVPVPIKTMASLLDASYNAGSAAVCRSPMVAKINAGNTRAGCEAFAGWYITTKNNGQRKVVPGLINRRNGEDHGDPRKSEKRLCLEGLSEVKTGWYLHESHAPVQLAEPAPPPVKIKKQSIWPWMRT
jgi:lysozyme